MTTAPQQAIAGSTDASTTRRDPLALLRIERSNQTTYRKPRRSWWPLILVLFFCGVGGFWFVVKNGRVPVWLNVSQATSSWVPTIIQNRPEVRLVSVVVQSGQSADAVVVATGYLESRQQARIGSRAAGRIEMIYFEEGVEVKANDLLAVLEHGNMDAALATAEASVSRAKTAIAEQEIAIADTLVTMNRAETLWKERSIAEAERDQAKFAYQSAIAKKSSLTADYELAIARRKEAEQVLENMFVRAPFAGTVISKEAELGESIMPGGMGEASGRGSVATIADLAHLEIECDVKEDFITRIVEGQKAEITIDAVPGRKYLGVVRKIIPMGDRARATIKVKVEVKDADDSCSQK